MLKLVERGIINEVNSLYEILKTLALLKTYIQLYMPLINPSGEQIRIEEGRWDELIAWLKQLASVSKVLNRDFDPSILQERGLSGN